MPSRFCCKARTSVGPSIGPRLSSSERMVGHVPAMTGPRAFFAGTLVREASESQPASVTRCVGAAPYVGRDVNCLGALSCRGVLLLLARVGCLASPASRARSSAAARAASAGSHFHCGQDSTEETDVGKGFSKKCLRRGLSACHHTPPPRHSVDLEGVRPGLLVSHDLCLRRVKPCVLTSHSSARLSSSMFGPAPKTSKKRESNTESKTLHAKVRLVVLVQPWM